MKIVHIRWNDACEYEDEHEIEKDDLYMQESVGFLFKETKLNVFICRDVDQDGSTFKRIRIPKKYIIEMIEWERTSSDKDCPHQR